MIRRPSVSTRTDTLLPPTPLVLYGLVRMPPAFPLAVRLAVRPAGRMGGSGHMIISGAVPIARIRAVVARIISGVAVVVIPAGTDRNRSVGTPVSVGHASGKGQAGDQQRGQSGRARHRHPHNIVSRTGSIVRVNAAR